MKTKIRQPVNTQGTGVDHLTLQLTVGESQLSLSIPCKPLKIYFKVEEDKGKSSFVKDSDIEWTFIVKRPEISSLCDLKLQDLLT